DVGDVILPHMRWLLDRPLARTMTNPKTLMALQTHLRTLVVAIVVILVALPARADQAFSQFLESLWPEAQKMGVARATFEMATRGLEPDLTLPDLDVPGRPERPPPGQPEFVQTPADYLRESSFERLAARGRKLYAEHRDTLAKIEQEFGVPGKIVLAIW